MSKAQDPTFLRLAFEGLIAKADGAVALERRVAAIETELRLIRHDALRGKLKVPDLVERINLLLTPPAPAPPPEGS